MGAMNQAEVWAFTEDFVQENASILAARAAAEVLGSTPVAPSTGSLLTVLAAAAGAHSLLEVGTGTGVSTLALLAGMPAGAQLTTLDIDSSRLQQAKSIIVEHSAHSGKRLRAIAGDATNVLPRLSAASYDFIFVDGGSELFEYAVYSCLTLLTSGGLLVVNDALYEGRVAQPALRDELTVAHRNLLREVQACVADVHVSLVHAHSGLYLIYKK